jgi:hypothetical protein
VAVHVASLLRKDALPFYPRPLLCLGIKNFQKICLKMVKIVGSQEVMGSHRDRTICPANVSTVKVGNSMCLER